MLALTSQITPLTTIHRTRLLPATGEVSVRKGEAVNPNSVIATADLSPRHYMLNVARGLGISASETEKYIERFLGNDIAQGDVIATRSGFGKRIVRSPVDGTIVFVADGHILIRVKTKPMELKAGYPGTISELIHERGAVISATGALVQGFWGNGKVNMGPLNVLATTPNHELVASDISPNMRGNVILAGHCKQADVLKIGAETRWRGMILGSLAPELISAATAVPYPIVVLEGLGHMPINPVAHKLLSTNQKRNIAVNADPFDRQKNTRPEVFIPVEAPPNIGDELPQETHLLTPGQRVRITRAPYQGVIAHLESILPGMAKFPSGIRTPAALIRLDDAQMIQVPLANLEILI